MGVRSCPNEFAIHFRERPTLRARPIAPRSAEEPKVAWMVTRVSVVVRAGFRTSGVSVAACTIRRFSCGRACCRWATTRGVVRKPTFVEDRPIVIDEAPCAFKNSFNNQVCSTTTRRRFLRRSSWDVPSRAGRA
jgi:hypothetical protein